MTENSRSVGIPSMDGEGHEQSTGALHNDSTTPVPGPKLSAPVTAWIKARTGFLRAWKGVGKHELAPPATIGSGIPASVPTKVLQGSQHPSPLTQHGGIRLAVTPPAFQSIQQAAPSTRQEGACHGPDAEELGPDALIGGAVELLPLTGETCVQGMDDAHETQHQGPPAPLVSPPAARGGINRSVEDGDVDHAQGLPGGCKDPPSRKRPAPAETAAPPCVDTPLLAMPKPWARLEELLQAHTVRMEASRDLGQPVAAQTQTLMADLEQLDGRRAQLRRRLATGERRLAVCSLQLGLEDSPSMTAGLKAAGKAREAQRFQLAKMLEEE
ncbi:hypothetical protein ACKKBG_A21380 [Auxenochlorella protothecoides x Auxenochlorella symbiontica]